MMTNARKKYEATAVGNIATLAPAAQQSIDDFQSDIREIQCMEEDGLVEITDERRESMSGYRLISIIMFKRLQ